MPFEPGSKKPARSGRKAGVKNLTTFADARVVVAKSGKEPIAEILKLIPSLEEKEQVKAWFEIQSWIASKPAPRQMDDDEFNELELGVVKEFEALSDATVLKLIKHEEGKSE
jgi:hypothetical protein